VNPRRADQSSWLAPLLAARADGSMPVDLFWDAVLDVAGGRNPDLVVADALLRARQPDREPVVIEG
jgi:hypothetical protein